jgi:DNA polymerase III subunit gamma/tau
MQLSIALRPRKLDDVYGQPAVIKQLKKRSETNDWAHAMLLKGMTGTGKTTVAQIIAMMLNCGAIFVDDKRQKIPYVQHYGSPCGNCASCHSIIEERFDRDTIRLDGGIAGKEDIVDFSSLVEGAPMYDKNKIFIIEEADQLSTKAKNALLKLIEKPMKNVYFILLSMVSNGISKPIMDRCQTYNFWAFTKKDVMLALQSDLKRVGLWGKEGIPMTFYTDVIPAIADSSQGSLRSAIQAVESCMAGEFYTLEEARQNLGIVSGAVINEMLLNLLDVKPAFFTVLEDVDLQEFFNLSYAILASAASYRITRQTKNEYFEEQTKALSQHSNLMDVLRVFDEIQAAPYLKKSLLISKIAQYYINKKGRRIIENE